MSEAIGHKLDCIMQQNAVREEYLREMAETMKEIRDMLAATYVPGDGYSPAAIRNWPNH